MILSEFLIVDNLWAITMVVMFMSPFFRLSIASCTSCSFFLSKADVASSKIRILGSLMKARAKAILCFSPPESCPPCAPTIVSRPSGRRWMILEALALRRASSMSCSDASGLP
mmetsp:Transcript_11859/g.11835  ORF Transcript_11859/g.11835 Transcript_11859/m.11835 type:complete len:113 (-) Transcript_11859:1382-1720(-)